MRSAAFSSRRSRFDSRAEADRPSVAASRSANPVAKSSRRSTRCTVASESASGAWKSSTEPDSSGIATSAYSPDDSTTLPVSTLPLTRARSATGSFATSRELSRCESAITASAGGAFASVSKAITRAFVLTAKPSTFCCQRTWSLGNAFESGTASSWSSAVRASTSRCSSDGTTMTYAAPSATATIATRASAMRTRIPPGILTRA